MHHLLENMLVIAKMKDQGEARTDRNIHQVGRQGRELQCKILDGPFV